MKNIFVIGAGRSSPYLIKYLLDHSIEGGYLVTIGDVSAGLAGQKSGNHSHCRAIAFDILNERQRSEEISRADAVVSLLPPHMHLLAAEDSLKHKKHFITASYTSPELRKLSGDIKKAGIIFITEMGVDPGIDHMSAMRIIDGLRRKEIKITSFESFTGGLVAPESDDNPWRYKITWNPRNVVLAGLGGVKFRHEGEIKYIPYHKVFSRIETVKIPKLGEFEAYANRDSLIYSDLYHLADVPTVFRGTLRRPGFCKAWDMLVQLGATDDTFVMNNPENLTNRDFINSFLIFRSTDSLELKLAYHLNLRIDSPTMEKLKWLGLFDDEPVEIRNGTPAQVLQSIIEKRWTIRQEDKDMIVMLHRIFFSDGSKNFELQSSLSVIGETAPLTAMAKTVGLPLGIAVKLILEGKFSEPGLHLPLIPALYEPVLAELEEYGIKFKEKVEEVVHKPGRIRK